LAYRSKESTDLALANSTLLSVAFTTCFLLSFGMLLALAREDYLVTFFGLAIPVVGKGQLVAGFILVLVLLLTITTIIFSPFKN